MGPDERTTYSLVEELKMMEEKVEQLQAKIVANKREVMIFKRK